MIRTLTDKTRALQTDNQRLQAEINALHNPASAPDPRWDAQQQAFDHLQRSHQQLQRDYDRLMDMNQQADQLHELLRLRDMRIQELDALIVSQQPAISDQELDALREERDHLATLCDQLHRQCEALQEKNNFAKQAVEAVMYRLANLNKSPSHTERSP